MTDLVNKRIADDKKLLLKKLRRTPVVQVACQKVGISRSTYYRWRKKDKVFAKKADEAIREGKLLINDLAESQLLSAIRDQNLTAIIYWLKHNHVNYATKLELSGKVDVDKETLSPEQEKLIKNALKLAGLITDSKKGNKKDED